MARITWHQEVNPKFEFGVDHGVFYPENGTPVPWNGLVNVTETESGSNVTSYYFDGLKFVDSKSPGNRQFTITSFSEPLGFETSLGNTPVVPGFILTKQPRSTFGLSYRTKIGNDLGYKIHLIYNAVAKSSNITYSTIENSSSIKTRSWTLDTIPLEYPGLKPSAHIVFDSTKVTDSLLDYLYSILYGTEGQPPRLPTVFELVNTFESWNQIQIVYSDAGISTLIPGIGDLTQTKVDGIIALTNTTRLGLTSDPGIYRLES